MSRSLKVPILNLLQPYMTHSFIEIIFLPRNMMKIDKMFTSTIVQIASCDFRITSSVFSHVLRNTPSIPIIPIPSTISRVKRNGIVSGVGNSLPCSNATPVSNKQSLKISHLRKSYLSIDCKNMVSMKKQS